MGEFLKLHHKRPFKLINLISIHSPLQLSKQLVCALPLANEDTGYMFFILDFFFILLRFAALKTANAVPSEVMQFVN
jgi:hypothetical protein